MNKRVLLQSLCCLAVFALYLYHMIQKQNTIHYLSLSIPKVSKDLKTLEEENARMRFMIHSFESPDHLVKLMKSTEYTHLHTPLLKDVFILPEGLALDMKKEPVDLETSFVYQPMVAAGAHQ